MIKTKAKQQLRNKSKHKVRYKVKHRKQLVNPMVLRSSIAVIYAVVKILRIIEQLYDLFR